MLSPPPPPPDEFICNSLALDVKVIPVPAVILLNGKSEPTLVSAKPSPVPLLEDVLTSPHHHHQQ